MRDERNEKILDKKRMDERLSKYATSDTHLPPTGSQPEPLEEPQYPLMVVSGLFESERRHLEHVDPRAHPRTPTRSIDQRSSWPFRHCSLMRLRARGQCMRRGSTLRRPGCTTPLSSALKWCAASNSEVKLWAPTPTPTRCAGRMG